MATPLGLVALLLIFLHTGPGQSFVRGKVVDSVGQRVNGSFELAELSFALGGDISLGKLRILDEGGHEVIALESLKISPSWSGLLGGTISIDEVALDGLTLALTQDEEGLLNIKTLFKKTPKKEPVEPPKKKKPRHIVVSKLHIGDVNLTVDKADGTRIAAEDVSLDGTIDTVPVTRTANVKLALGANFKLQKKQDGLSVSVSGISTGVAINLTDGKGTLAVTPTKAQARISQEGFRDREIELDLQGVDVEVNPGTLAATLTKLALGAVVLQSLELSGGVGDSGLSGDQRVQLVGLHVDAEHVNKLLQRQLLATNVDIETKLTGPPERIVLESQVDTDGGKIDVDGIINASNPAQPIYDLSLVISDIATERLLHSDKVPPVTIDRVRLGLRGDGRTKEGAEVDLGVHVAGVSVKNYFIDDLVIEARYDGSQIRLEPLVVQAYGQEVIVTGWVDLTRKLVDAHLTMVGDVGATLARLRESGLPVKSALPRRLLVLAEDTVAIDVRGSLEGMLDADVAINNLQIAGGGVFANAHAKLYRNVDAGPNDKKVELRDLDAVVELRSINLKHALALRGKKLDGLTGSVSAKIVIDDVPKDPWVDYRLEARLQASNSARIDTDEPVLVAIAKGHATKHQVDLNLDVTGRDGPARFEIVQANARVPLHITDTHRGIAPYRPLHVELRMPKVPLRELANYVPKRVLKGKKIPRGSLDLALNLDGTAAAPKGNIALDLQARLHPLRKQRVKLATTISSANRPKVSIDTELGVWADAGESQTLKGQLHAELTRSPLLPGAKDVDWSLDLDLLPLNLDDWLELRVLGLSGIAKAGIHLKGNRKDIGGRVDVNLANFKREKLGPLDVNIGVGIEPDKTALDINAAVHGVQILDIGGSIGRPGLGLLAALRDKTPGKSTADKLGNPPIDVTIAIPKHEPKTWAFLKPKLGKLPGMFGGEVVVGGDLKMPVAKGELGYSDFETIKGGQGRVAVVLDVNADRIGANIEVGQRSGDVAPVTIAVKVPRTSIKPYLDTKKCWTAAANAAEGTPKPQCDESVRLPINATIRAEQVDIEDLVPKFAVEGVPVKFDGLLAWKLDGDLKLDPQTRFSADGNKLSPLDPSSTVAGKLDFTDGLISLPGTNRQYRDAQIHISHDLTEVSIDGISLRESTADNPDRRLDIKAHIALNNFKPGKLTAHIAARKWLVFGHEKVGPIDAPWGDLTADVNINGDVGQAIKKVEVSVDKLEILVPERFRRAHQPPMVSVGDVIHLGKDNPVPGKLPVMAPKPPHIPPDPDAKTGLDLVVKIPTPGRLLLQNMELHPVGQIVVTRRGNGKDIDGELKMVGGHLDLGGRQHDLVRGKFIFKTPECGGGCMDLDFARQEHDATLRDVSHASGGDTVNIHLEGPIANRRAVLSGAASPGTLFDLLAAHNAGRQRYASQPDMPTTNTTEYPQFNNLLLLSYLAVNVPNLLFMDKVAAWADAYDGRGTEGYGRVRHFEAEAYGDDGDFRVRAVARPQTAGASEAEMNFDWLWAHDSQTAFGVGVSGGDRLGGGPGVFLEWSSKD